jgi:hypothetical protein
MDAQTTAALAIAGLVVSVGGSILAVVNHTRCRSNCFGQKLEVSLDVEKTTPPGEKLEIKVPKSKSEVKLDV